MKNQYTCPKCDGQLRAYKEYVFEKLQLINKKTGKLNKKVSRTEPEKVDVPGGVECVECDFIYYGLDSKSNYGEEHEYLNRLFQIINESEDGEEVS